jgi:7-cyano-7-deazaguanine synthase
VPLIVKNGWKKKAISRMSKAVILLSGGLDSTTTLAIAKSQGFDCHALSFDYGQKQKSELNAAKQLAELFSATEHRTMRISWLNSP